MKPKLFILAILLLPAPLQAALVRGYEFNTDGSAEGFVSPGVIGLVVASGFISGTASNNDPQLVNNTNFDSKTVGSAWTTLTYRVREFDGVGDLVTDYSSAGIAILLSQNTNGSGAFNPTSNAANISAVDSLDGFFTVSVNISGYTQSTVKYLRVDPIGGPDAANHTFDLDFIRVYDSSAVPEPSVAILGALGGLALLRRRRR